MSYRLIPRNDGNITSLDMSYISAAMTDSGYGRTSLADYAYEAPVALITRDMLYAEMSVATQISILSGDLISGGRHISIEPTVVNVSQGTPGFSRHDIVYCNINVDSNEHASYDIRILEGTPVIYAGTDYAEDPDLELSRGSGSPILINNYTNIPLYRIVITNLSTRLERIFRYRLGSSDLADYLHYDITNPVQPSSLHFSISSTASNFNTVCYLRNMSTGKLSRLSGYAGSVGVYNYFYMNPAGTTAAVKMYISLDPTDTYKQTDPDTEIFIIPPNAPKFDLRGVTPHPMRYENVGLISYNIPDYASNNWQTFVQPTSITILEDGRIGYGVQMPHSTTYPGKEFTYGRTAGSPWCIIHGYSPDEYAEYLANQRFTSGTIVPLAE